MQCAIIRQEKETYGKKDVVLYVMAVTNEDGKTWELKKRYSSLRKLHENLMKLGMPKIAFPRKTWNPPSRDVTLDKRVLALDEFVRTAMTFYAASPGITLTLNQYLANPFQESREVGTATSFLSIVGPPPKDTGAHGEGNRLITNNML